MPSWLSRSLRPFLYSSSMYSYHLFLISSASVRFLQFLSLFVPIFIWKVLLLSPIFLKRSLVFPILLRDTEVEPLQGKPLTHLQHWPWNDQLSQLNEMEHHATVKSRLLIGIYGYERCPCYVCKCCMIPVKLRIPVHIYWQKNDWKDTCQNICSVIPDCWASGQCY